MLSPTLSETQCIAEQPITSEGIRLFNTIVDIAHHVEIRDDFSLNHANVTSVELVAEFVQGLQQLPVSQQDHYLRCKIATYLYGLYDDGELQPMAATIGLTSQRSNELLQNQTVGLRSHFFRQLQHRNTGQGYYDPGWVVVGEAVDGLVVVHKDGLTMHIHRDHHLAEPMVNMGDAVAVRLPNNLMESGCYVAVGNQGPCPKDEPEHIINLYFNLSPTGILEAMGALTAALNQLGLPFDFAIPHNLESYPDRCDGGTLKITRQAYDQIQPSLVYFYRTHASHFREKVPLFTKVLAPGLGLSEQPTHAFILGESFSIHQFQVLAEGLVSAWRQAQIEPQVRIEVMRQALFQYHIDLNAPYLNPGSDGDYPFNAL
jgi:hypothetical protein